MRSTIIFSVAIFLLSGCMDRMSISEKFTELRDADYSSFHKMSITVRDWQCVEVVYDSLVMCVNHRLWNMSEIKRIVTLEGEDIVIMPIAEYNNLKDALKVFEDLSLTSLKADEEGNLLMTIPWNDRYTYYFLRLNPGSSLDEVKVKFGEVNENYSNYDGFWYMRRVE